MKHLLVATALIEGGTGLGLLIAPAIVVYLLLGAEITGAAIPLARVTAVALLALALACWLERSEAPSGAARGLVAALPVYNFGAMLVLLYAGIQSRTVGAVFWVAVVLHAAMGIWCLALLLRKPRPKLQG